MSGRRRQIDAPAPAGGQGPKRMRPAGLAGAGGLENGSSSAPATVHNLTAVEEVDVLDCGVCYHLAEATHLPGKSIARLIPSTLCPHCYTDWYGFVQCAVGHALCSSCLQKLKDARKCHVCRVTMPGGYHALERVVDSMVCGPCPHVPYGCGDARLVYHARQEHILHCPHAPCYCPGNDCGFVGSVTTLVEHLATVHSWPCTAEPSADGSFGVKLRDGFNFLTAVRGGAKYLLLLDMATTPFVHIISAVWIGSVPAMDNNNSAPPAPVDTTCDLELRFWDMRSQFRLPCTTLSNRLPDPNATFHRFFFPNYLGRSDKATLHVTAVISIDSS